jgi:hypothetical protein
MNHRIDATFVVDVGKKPYRERFTVHQDLFIQRSKFFRAAASPQWKKPGKTCRLVDDNPMVFAIYVHCLYYSTKDLEERVEAGVVEVWDEDNGSIILEENAAFRLLAMMDVYVHLYILADKLLDPSTANYIIDELIGFASRNGCNIMNSTITNAYDSTIDGNPLRKLVRDWHISISWTWKMVISDKAWAALSHESLQDVIFETSRLRKYLPYLCVKEASGNRVSSRPKGFYHQKVE